MEFIPQVSVFMYANNMEFDDGQIRKLHAMNLTPTQIARELGNWKCGGSVARRLKQLGLEIRHSQTGTKVNGGKIDIRFMKSERGLELAAEFYAQFFFTLSGYDVLKPPAHAPYDLMVSLDGKLQKIQVKSSTAMKGSGNYEFRLNRVHVRVHGQDRKFYSKNDCDFFFLMDETRRTWLIPFELVDGNFTVTPAMKFPGYEVTI